MPDKKRTVLILRIIMIPIGIITIVVFPPWDGIRAWLAPLPETVQEQVDHAVDRGLDGIIVYVDQAGSAPAFYAAGWKNSANRVPAESQALFKIGSISKLYTAAAAAKLVSSGSLSLDDTLADHLPELVGSIEFADQITLRMLLQHRSGIPNFTDQPVFDWSEPPTSFDEYLALILDEPADFAPGADYAYSNTNFLLLRRILDNTLGYSHSEYIAREILVPLGLTQTHGSLGEVASGDVVSGYHYGYDDDFKNTGGSMVATAQDVGVFLRALNDGSLFTDEEQAIYSSVYEYGHTGWVLGYHSIARYHEDLDAVVVQFVNTTGGDTELTTTVVYGRIVRILRERN